MNENIKIAYKNGKVDGYITKSTSNLQISSMMFKTEEEAEFVVAMAKLFKANNIPNYELNHSIRYVFRVMGINNEWVE